MAYVLISIGLVGIVAALIRFLILSPDEAWRIRKRNLEQQGFVMQEDSSSPPSWGTEFIIAKLIVAAIVFGFIMWVVMIISRY